MKSDHISCRKIIQWVLQVDQSLQVVCKFAGFAATKAVEPGKEIVLLMLFLLGISIAGEAQNTSVKPYDITRGYTVFGLGGQRFDLVDGQIWQWDLFGRWAFDEERHQVGVEVPFVRSDYFTNIETRTGMGDLKVRYMAQVMNGSFGGTLNTASIAMEVNFPTGEVEDGHGLGSIVISPLLNYGIWLHPQVSFFSSLRYAHSTQTVGGVWSSGGTVPDNPDLQVERKIRDLLFEATGVLEVVKDGWLSLGMVYSRFFSEQESTVDIRPEIGKLWDQKYGLSLRSIFWIAGRRRVNSWIEFEFAFYPLR